MMHITNKKLEGQYLTLLQNNFIDNLNPVECEELLVQMLSLNYGPFEIIDEPLTFSKQRSFLPSEDLGKENVENIFEYAPNKLVNLHYLDKKRHYFKIMYFSKIGSNSAHKILDDIVSQYSMFHYLDHYGNLLEIKKNNNGELNTNDKLERYSKLHDLFELYMKDENSYQNLSDYWNKYSQFWHMDLYKTTLNGSLWKEEQFIRFVQQDIGNKIFIEFMASPYKHRNFSKEMPSIIDMMNWYDASREEHNFHRLLLPFLKQEHFEVISEFKGSGNYESFIDKVFGITNYSEINKFNNVSNLIYLIKKICTENVNTDMLFNQNTEIKTLGDFYATRDYEDCIDKEIYEQLSGQFSQFIFNARLENSLTTNENSKKKRKI